MNWHDETKVRRELRHDSREARKAQERELMFEKLMAVLFGILLYALLFFGTALCY